MDERGVTHLFYRAVRAGYVKKEHYGYDNYVSVIGHAISDDGLRFRDRTLWIDLGDTMDRFGCEDARVTRLEGEYLITYTGLTSPAFTWKGYRPLLATTRDLATVEKHGVLGPDVENKDVVIFPERIRGKVAVLQRIGTDIQIIYYESLQHLKRGHEEVYWKSYLGNLSRSVVLRRMFTWEAMKVGAGPPPIKTKSGWLLIYHGVDGRNVYRAGAALLDGENPQRVVNRSPLPILSPSQDYERYGDIPNVIFPTGAVVKDGRLLLYYGAADRCCCLGTCILGDLVDHIRRKYSTLLDFLKGNRLVIRRNIDQRRVKLHQG
jgi:predicted GH43/DUF377 family glycosyl hydrolase